MIWFILFFASFCNCELFKYGNVSYQNAVIYEIVNPKNLHLKLTSLTGDADLYIFKAKFDKTSTNFSEYQFKSDTFGEDVITIDIDYMGPLTIVVLGVAQGDSEYRLEISRVKPEELDYQAIDDAIQNSPGSSYADLHLQHSFDSDSFYANVEEDRLKLLSSNLYLNDGKQHTPQVAPQTKPISNADQRGKRGQQKPSKKGKFFEMEEGSSLHRLLITLLEVIAHVVL